MGLYLDQVKANIRDTTAISMKIYLINTQKVFGQRKITHNLNSSFTDSSQLEFRRERKHGLVF